MLATTEIPEEATVSSCGFLQVQISPAFDLLINIPLSLRTLLYTYSLH